MNSDQKSTAFQQITPAPSQVGLLTVVEAAVFLGLSVGTVYHMISEHRLPVVRISRRCIRFRVSDLERWVREHTETERR